MGNKMVQRQVFCLTAGGRLRKRKDRAGLRQRLGLDDRKILGIREGKGGHEFLILDPDNGKNDVILRTRKEQEAYGIRLKGTLFGPMAVPA